MEKSLNILALFLFIIFIGTIYAFVFDCEPLTQEQHYEHEREVYNHDHLCYPDWDFPNFPSFEVWVEQNDQKEQRMHEWLANIASKASEGSAIAFDPWYDTRESQGGSAPENWNRGERD